MKMFGTSWRCLQGKEPFKTFECTKHLVSSSPAEMAGLRQYSDYIIGADSVLHESEVICEKIPLAIQLSINFQDLFSLIEAHEGRPLKLYVYNTETDHCRFIIEILFTCLCGDWLCYYLLLLMGSGYHTLMSKIVREVSITPNGAWGGEGSLGCGIGYGKMILFIKLC